MARRFHVRFVRPDGWTYEAWPSGESESDAVLAADALLEYRERIGIRDYLQSDGLTVQSPAQLSIRPVTDPPDNEFALRCTRPDGTVIEK